MTIAWLCGHEKNRLRAVFLCLVGLSISLIAGCGGVANTPVVSTFAAFFPGDEDVSKQAAEISYASIKLRVAGSGGLLVLSEKSGGVTFWQSSGSQTIVLKNGYLDATRGLPSDLEMTRVSAQSSPATRSASPWMANTKIPLTYTVTRSWSTSDGRTRSDRATARLECRDQPERVELPLVTLPLQRCEETLRWDGGGSTVSTIWRNPDDNRIWAVDTVPWPGAQEIAWSVARPWW